MRGVSHRATEEGYIGSGSLLAGTNWILTAAHVVWTDTLGGRCASRLRCISTCHGPGDVPATQVVVNPAYDGDDDDGTTWPWFKIQYVPTGVKGSKSIAVRTM